MNERKSLYGIVGYPVEHSLSPLIHNAAFKELGVDASYGLFSLEEQALDGFFQKLRADDSEIFGLNVTVPYKETVIKYMDRLSPFAEKVGAVNTIVIDEKRKLTGYNTDAPGFLSHLAEIGFKTEEKKVAIIGAGGVSRAMIAALCLIKERPASIRIYDAVKNKAEDLIDDLKRRIDVSIVKAAQSIDDLNIEIADFAINATPVGMKKNDPCLIDPQMFHPGMHVYDVIYRPAETIFLKEAKVRGAQTANGLAMLYYQGVLAFQHWADIELSDDVKRIMRRCLEEGACR
ncbi:MAG TPA: shikimate dehydrogenase [Candidatus Omnitrophota bacterium]|nr:shikimate dehydrogenase [Candidatus Omnitrophota bacterium]